MSTLVAAWVLASTSMAVQAPSAIAGADAMRYGALVQQYLRDDGDKALREIVTWSPGALYAAVGEVEDDAIRVVLPAAVTLHTEAALFLYEQEDSEEADAQWDCARRLARLTWTKEQDTFFRAWYRGAGLYSLGSYGVDGAIALLERGVLLFPDDPSLVLALGQAYEARGTFRNGRVPSVQPNLSSAAKKDLHTAEGLYRELLSRDPLLWEARLRMGRCMWLDGRVDAAFFELLRTASDADTARLRHLAHLFTGDLYRRQSRVPEARQEFARAVEVWPSGQTAALGLAEALHSLGERTEAGAALQAAIAEGRSTPRIDPYHGYHFGDRAEHKRLLEAARDIVRAPSAR